MFQTFNYVKVSLIYNDDEFTARDMHTTTAISEINMSETNKININK